MSRKTFEFVIEALASNPDIYIDERVINAVKNTIISEEFNYAKENYAAYLRRIINKSIKNIYVHFPEDPLKSYYVINGDNSSADYIDKLKIIDRDKPIDNTLRLPFVFNKEKRDIDIQSIFGETDLEQLYSSIVPEYRYKKAYIILYNRYRDLSTGPFIGGDYKMRWNYSNTLNFQQGIVNSFGHIRGIKEIRLLQPTIANSIATCTTTQMLIEEFTEESYRYNDSNDKDIRYHFSMEKTNTQALFSIEPIDYPLMYMPTVPYTSSHYNIDMYNPIFRFNKKIRNVDSFTIRLFPADPPIYNPPIIIRDIEESAYSITHGSPTTVVTSIPHEFSDGDLIILSLWLPVYVGPYWISDTTDPVEKNIAVQLNTLASQGIGIPIRVTSPTSFEFVGLDLTPGTEIRKRLAGLRLLYLGIDFLPAIYTYGNPTIIRGVNPHGQPINSTVTDVFGITTDFVSSTPSSAVDQLNSGSYRYVYDITFIDEYSFSFDYDTSDATEVDNIIDFEKRGKIRKSYSTIGSRRDHLDAKVTYGDPTVFTTSYTHGLNTGEKVIIEKFAENETDVTVIDNYSFSINLSTSGGADDSLYHIFVTSASICIPLEITYEEEIIENK